MSGALRVQIWKELRALLPWWGAVAVTLLVLGQLINLGMIWPVNSFLAVRIGVCVYIIGSVALGALSVGHEYSYRALPVLLAQPISRTRVLATKLGILAVLLGSLAAIAVSQLWTAEYPWRQVAVQALLILPPVVGLLLTPWLTMVSRGPLAGAVFSVAAPVLIYLAAMQVDYRAPDALRFVVTGTMGLAAIGGALTWWTFLRLEAIDGPHAEVSVPVWLRRRVPDDKWSSARVPQVRRPIWMLVRKELRLQQMTFVVAGLYVVLWLAVLTARQAVPGVIWLNLDVFTGMYGALIALLAGAMASAEERQLGTADWMTLLPVAGGKQWAVKVGTALGLLMLLGVCLPIFLLVIQSLIPQSSEVEAYYRITSLEAEWFVFLFALCPSALYVSSLSTSGMRAFLASFPTIALAALGAALLLAPEGFGSSLLFKSIAPGMTPFSGLDRQEVGQIMQFFVVVPILATLAVLLMRFAYRNHRSADRSAPTIRFQIEMMLVGAIGGVVLLTFAEALLEAGLRPFPR